MTWWKSLIRRYQTFVNLAGSEQLLLVRAMCWLPIVAILVRVKGMNYTQDLLGRLPLDRCATDSLATGTDLDRTAEIWMTVKIVRVAVRYYQPWANCLKHSLVLWYLLRVRGIISEIGIGIERDCAQFSAHAWVECQGMILNDSADVHQRFQAFERRFDRPVGEKL